MSTVQFIRGSSLKNSVISLLQNSIPSMSKASLNAILISQKRNKSTNLDKDLAQNIFFSQHRPVLFNDMKFEFEIQSIQNERQKVIEPVPFSSSLPKQCKSYSEMKYSNQDYSDYDKNEEEKSQILAAWDILDCMFTGRTSSYTTKEEDNSNTVMPPQPLKSISEDTFLSCVNNSLYHQQEEDDIDIDILFHQLLKNSSSSNTSKNSSSSSSSSSNSSSINSKDATLKK